MNDLRLSKLTATLLVFALLLTPIAESREMEAAELAALYAGARDQQRDALSRLVAAGDRKYISVLITALRFAREGTAAIVDALKRLTGEDRGEDWFAWMLYQQAHPENGVPDDFAVFKSDLLARIDPNFLKFIDADVQHRIRLEEIAWGGVVKDGIPALDYPTLISASQASYLSASEPVFGIEINGDARAYPYRIMDWHEMFNDEIGGVSVALAYCTLCGSGILYESTTDDYPEPFVFGSSGFLYRSNKLMYDRQTHSLWNQFTGEPVVGPLTNSGIRLNVRPVVTTTWGDWKRQHPDTKVLALDTGFERDYRPGSAYGDYFSNPDLMFPAIHNDESLAAKDEVFVLRVSPGFKAWPLDQFSGGAAVNDRVGVFNVALIGDAKSRTVRAYRRGNNEFTLDEGRLKSADGREWAIEESDLIAEDGETLSRLPGHLAYAFAWAGNYQ
ncbi:MAG: DUF3179 domain-containing protein [Pseudomonadota bacterium]